MKFRFQINGTIEVTLSTIPAIQDLLAGLLRKDEVNITGMVVYEIPEQRYRRKQ